MNQIHDFFYVTTSADKMTTEIYCKKTYENIDIQLDVLSIMTFLEDQKVTYGIDEKAVKLLIENLPSNKFPLTIAKGTNAEDGTDGNIKYELNYNSDIARDPDWNFREVMRIPSVKKGDKLATITLPTKGKSGMNVQGIVLRARPGKPNTIKPGRNVVYNKEDQSFYANIEGQVSVTDHNIQIHSVYVVNESLSMKTGNLDFIGSIVIHGDVPTGYIVKAKGDVRIFGIVEAATVIAGGSIYISEGLAGLKKGKIQADNNIHISYINQGISIAGDSIYVENSIMHSRSVAKNHIYCQHGNIIGGSLSVGKTIEAKDIGNRLSTETIINLGLDQKINDQQVKLEARKKELTDVLEKLTIIGADLKSRRNQQDVKIQLTLQRQRHSYEKTSDEIDLINNELYKMNGYLGSKEEANLIVKNTIYSNVVISFGKYKRTINKKRQYVQMKLNNNDIVIHALEE